MNIRQQKHLIDYRDFKQYRAISLVFFWYQSDILQDPNGQRLSFNIVEDKLGQIRWGAVTGEIMMVLFKSLNRMTKRHE